MTELSTAEAAVVARFEAGADAEESLRARVARAMWDSRAAGAQWWELNEYARALYRQYADAAIATMRGEA